MVRKKKEQMGARRRRVSISTLLGLFRTLPEPAADAAKDAQYVTAEVGHDDESRGVQLPFPNAPTMRALVSLSYQLLVSTSDAAMCRALCTPLSLIDEENGIMNKHSSGCFAACGGREKGLFRSIHIDP